MSFWGLPNDPIAWTSLLLAMTYAAVAARSRARPALPAWGFCALVGAGAIGASWGYVVAYLEGGPRIIDATTYLLQAKTYASGQWAFPVDGPVPSYHGRFLLQDDAGRLSGIFPPGYPLALALAVVVGAPMALGPLVAGAITVLTYALARRWFRAEAPARLAALLSLLSVTLRYHTADTMSHGWCALLWLGSAYAASFRRNATAALAGLLVGWLIATRPVTGLVAGVFVGALVYVSSARGAPIAEDAGRHRRIALRLSCFAAALAPGVSFLIVQQRAVTGAWLVSSQYLYYARSDHPAECFQYGFGARVGCQGEHGDFLQQYMPNGYGWLEAAATTGRRLSLHVSDAGNWPLFGVLLLWCAWRGRHEAPVRWLTGAVVAQVAAYAPFYFDGNYPAGGARLFADILPFEHVLLGWGLSQTRLGAYAPALMLAGFSLYGSHQHAWLETEQNGRPAFGPRPPAAPADALIFVAGDHAFNLGYEPDRRRAPHLIARQRGDAHDYALWLHHHRPASFRYFAPAGQAPRLLPYVPENSHRYQAEALWPALEVVNGSLERTRLSGCARGEHGLELHPESEAMRAQFSLWVPTAGEYRLSVRAAPSLRWQLSQHRLAMRRAGACASLSEPVRLEAGAHPLLVTATERSDFDSVSLEPLNAALAP